MIRLSFTAPWCDALWGWRTSTGLYLRSLWNFGLVAALAGAEQRGGAAAAVDQ